MTTPPTDRTPLLREGGKMGVGGGGGRRLSMMAADDGDGGGACFSSWPVWEMTVDDVQ